MIINGHRKVGDVGLKELEYGKSSVGDWFVRPPNVPHEINITGNALKWNVVEHEDGTITVDPSINVQGYWHGYLRRGVWIEC